MKRDPRDYLDDMLVYARQAHGFVQGLTAAEFLSDTRTRYAVIYALHVIGEAAKKIPAEICARYPQIPWSDIIGMRNRLVHDYLGTNSNVVFDTATRFLPELTATLPTIIADLGGSEDGPAP
jgi:uncharacterized protein with HEPN domain